MIQSFQPHTNPIKILIPTHKNFQFVFSWASFISLIFLIISPKFQSFPTPNSIGKTHPTNPRNTKPPKISPSPQSLKSTHTLNSHPFKENPINLPNFQSLQPPKSIGIHNANNRQTEKPIISSNSQFFRQPNSLRSRKSLKLQSFPSKESVQSDYRSSNITMKVHPLPSKKRNMTVQFRPLTGGRQAEVGSGSNKKLRRLPHIFSRVLELPFRADAEVEVEESPEFFRFVAETDGVSIGCDVKAHTVEIHPGVTKIVVRPNGCVELLSLDQLELDMWRFRLPESTRPELASAVCVDGELIVTVPKADDGMDGGDGEVWGAGGNRLVLVQ